MLIRRIGLLILLTNTRYLDYPVTIILVSGIRLFFIKILWSLKAKLFNNEVKTKLKSFWGLGKILVKKVVKNYWLLELSKKTICL